MLYITLVGALYNNEYRTILTLDDIKALVNEKGKELMYADFKDYVQFANNLDEAYTMANQMLERTDLEYNNPSYFKNEYWNRLKELL